MLNHLNLSLPDNISEPHCGGEGPGCLGGWILNSFHALTSSPHFVVISKETGPPGVLAHTDTPSDQKRLFFLSSSFFFFFFFVALPDSFENKLKIVCRHNLPEHSTASKITQLSSVVLVPTMNLKMERKRYL